MTIATDEATKNFNHAAMEFGQAYMHLVRAQNLNEKQLAFVTALALADHSQGLQALSTGLKKLATAIGELSANKDAPVPILHRR